MGKTLDLGGGFFEAGRVPQFWRTTHRLSQLFVRAVSGLSLRLADICPKLQSQAPKHLFHEKAHANKSRFVAPLPRRGKWFASPIRCPKRCGY